MKYILTIIYFLVFISTLLVSCKSEVKAPVKIASIPKDAVWGGGVDGGVWISYKITDTEQSKYHCKIFNDSNGSLIAEGEYVLRNVPIQNIIL